MLFTQKIKEKELIHLRHGLSDLKHVVAINRDKEEVGGSWTGGKGQEFGVEFAKIKRCLLDIQESYQVHRETEFEVQRQGIERRCIFC